MLEGAVAQEIQTGIALNEHAPAPERSDTLHTDIRSTGMQRDQMVPCMVDVIQRLATR